tara:strand:+ start:130 stop:741 length:612 start_codon:yes stop_codon:yes gene_type:complete
MQAQDINMSSTVFFRGLALALVAAGARAAAGPARDGRAAPEALQPQQHEQHEQHEQQPHRLSAKLTPDLIALLQPGGGLKGPPESLLALVEADGTIRHPPSKVDNPDGTSATLPQHLIQADGSLAGPPLDLLQKTADMYHGMEKHKDALDRARSFSPEAAQVRGARGCPEKHRVSTHIHARVRPSAPSNPPGSPTTQPSRLAA